MGTVTTRLEILSQDGEDRLETVDLLVDTGAVLSMLPGALLDNLGVQRIGKVTARIADGRLVEWDVGNARLRVEGQEVWARVIFALPGQPSVLGLTVLEQLGLTVDPVNRRLVPTEIILYWSPLAPPSWPSAPPR